MKTILPSLALVVVLSVAAALAQEKSPDLPFAFAAPAFIKELDTKYPAQPPQRRPTSSRTPMPQRDHGTAARGGSP